MRPRPRSSARRCASRIVGRVPPQPFSIHPIGGAPRSWRGWRGSMLPHRSLKQPARLGVPFGALLLALATLPDAAPAPRAPHPPTSSAVSAERLPGFDHADLSRRQFGLLEFRGGLVLTSTFKQFG